MNENLSRQNKRKAEWFDRGVRAFKFARPDAPDVYACPLCIRGFSSYEHLTFEHAPTDAVGGKEVTLTCSECNRRGGHEFDVHMAKRYRVERFLAGKQEEFVRLEAGGHIVTSLMRWGQTIALVGQEKKSNPEAVAAHRAHFDDLVDTQDVNFSFRITYPFGKFDAHREAVGWLKSAYVVASALLGHTWFMTPELEGVRKQIELPDETIIGPFLFRLESADDRVRAFRYVYHPTELRSFMVQMGRRLVFLPSVFDQSDIYERISHMQANRLDERELSTLEFTWPHWLPI